MKSRIRLLWALLAVVSVAAGCNSPKYKGKTASMWAADLDDRDDYKRRVACQNLGMMGPGALAEAKRIGPLLNDVNAGVQSFCAEALSKMGPEVIEVVTPYLESDEPFVRVHAAGVIVSVAPQNKPARKALITAFSGLGNADLSKMAKEVILKQDGLMVEELMELLNSPFADLRLASVKTIGKLAEKARVATDAVIKLSREDKNWQVRKAGMHSLAAIALVEKSKVVFEHAIEEENETEEEVRDAAAMMLVYTGVRKGTTGMEGVETEGQEAEAPKKIKGTQKPGVSITIK